MPVGDGFVSAADPEIPAAAGGALLPARCNVCHAIIQHNAALWSNPAQDYDMCLSCYPTNSLLAQQRGCVRMTLLARLEQTMAILNAAHAAQGPAVDPGPFVPLYKQKRYKCWDHDGTVHVKSIWPGDHEEFLRIMKTHKRIAELSSEEDMGEQEKSGAHVLDSAVKM